MNETNVCEYCLSGHFQAIGIHIPTDFDDRASSRDGVVFVAKCDACALYPSDTDAAAQVQSLTGWVWLKSYDRDDAIDPEERAEKATTDYYRPYFAITLAEATAFAGRKGA